MIACEDVTRGAHAVFPPPSSPLSGVRSRPTPFPSGRREAKGLLRHRVLAVVVAHGMMGDRRSSLLASAPRSNLGDAPKGRGELPGPANR